MLLLGMELKYFMIQLGIELLTRDYSEVQKGKDICDRVCGVCKNRMRSWGAIGHDLLNAHDIKEGMQYAGGVKNTKIATAEVIPGAGMNLFNYSELSFHIFLITRSFGQDQYSKCFISTFCAIWTKIYEGLQSFRYRYWCLHQVQGNKIRK